MTRLRKLLHSLPLILSPAMVCAADSAPDSAGAHETLLAAPPPGWQLLYQFNNQQIRITEFIPPGQGVDNWDRKVSFESYGGQEGRDPIDALLGEAERMDEECKARQHFNLFSGLENGYPTSTRLIMCTEHKVSGGGAVRMMKAIQGEERFYLIALTRKVPPFELNQPDMSKDEIAGWASYLRMITLCLAGSADHPCPPPGPSEKKAD